MVLSVQVLGLLDVSDSSLDDIVRREVHQLRVSVSVFQLTVWLTANCDAGETVQHASGSSQRKTRCRHCETS